MEAEFQAALGPEVKVFCQATLVADSLADYLDRHPNMVGPGQASMHLTTGDPGRVSDKATQFLRTKDHLSGSLIAGRARTPYVIRSFNEVLMTHKVAILGASGYTGAELVRLIATHPTMEISALSADRKAGQAMTDVFPQFRHLDLPELVKVANVDFDAVDLVFAGIAPRAEPGDRQNPARGCENRRSGRRFPAARPGGLRGVV